MLGQFAQSLVDIRRTRHPTLDRFVPSLFVRKEWEPFDDLATAHMADRRIRGDPVEPGLE